jgi:N-acyl-phosphatidylethanolamine-hydrolysing phospholipase D
MAPSRSISTLPSHHVVNFSGKSYTCPWPSAAPPTWTDLLQQSFPLSWPKDKLHSHPKTRQLKVVKPDWGVSSVKAIGLDKSKCIIGTWLGHASTLVELPLVGTATPGKSLWLLFDPIFSPRAGPTQWTGPRRVHDSPCQVSELKGCDAIFISHNHYDHLDLASIKSLLRKFPEARYFVPLGNASWLSSTGVPPSLIHELDWWAYREYSPSDFSHAMPLTTTSEAVLRFSCVPAQHNSGRIGADSGRTLWCGWVIEQLLNSKDESSTSSYSRKGSIYHAGDTGYRRSAKSSAICPVFTEIGSRYGPIDLSFIPIWRGGTLGFISNLGLRLSHEDIPATFHASPKDAVAIHQDIRSRNSIAIHFGTFVGSQDETHEAVIELAEAKEDAGVPGLDEKAEGKGRMGAIDIGESFVVEME